MQEQVNVIVIYWELMEFSKENILKMNKSHDYGIYSIYGEHFAYGKDALLYIGKAEDRTFSIRMLDGGRFDSDFNESTIIPKTMRIGRICKSYDEKENESTLFKLKDYYTNWEKNINEAERILIGTHIPALNKQLNHRLTQMNYGEKFHKLNDSDDYKPHYILINKGDYGSLLPEISTIRNSYNYYMFEKFLDTKERNSYI